MNLHYPKTMLRALFLTILLTLSHAVAQNEGVKVVFRLLCFEQRDGIDALWVTQPGADAGNKEVVLFTGGFSEEHEGVFAAGKAELFVEETRPDGTKSRKVLASGKLADSPRQAFLLIPTGEKSGPIYRILCFDDRESAFPMGATRLINLATFPVRLAIAEKELPPIEPGGMQIYPMVKTVDEWNMFKARIDFGVKADQWVPVSTQSWKASDQKRDWVVTSFSAETRQPVVRLYKDIPPWRKPNLEIGKPEGQP